MKLGIDFGTTRIVVAHADRGNYPIITFDAPDSATRDWFPPLLALRGGERLFGWQAWAAQETPGWTVVRSIKRLLATSGPQTHIEVAGESLRLTDVLVGMAGALREALQGASSLGASPRERLEVVLGVPANANTNQRFLTVEAFRSAGFEVLGLLNEPSAAAIEFAHGQRKLAQKKEGARLLVYDFGGGTFDASLVETREGEHTVIASAGNSTCGGDDFDELLAGLALNEAGVSEDEREAMAQAEVFQLHEECQRRKEGLHPNTRQIAIDLGLVRQVWSPVSVSTGKFYEACRPLVAETLRLTGEVAAARGSDGSDDEIMPEALYVTGGGSELPLIGRMLRETFGRRVRRSAYTRSATAIGLAIQADAQSGYRLREQFSRYFGVWREGEEGQTVIFDPLFAKGLTLPSPDEPPLAISRRYRPAHNVGHYRYLECSRLSGAGRPDGDITVWDEIRFPFDPALRNERSLAGVPVKRVGGVDASEVEERTSCDSNGMLAVTLTTISDQFHREYRLGRWSSGETSVAPARLSRRRMRR
jgi:molecular chaperone DnaK (HSP70)